MNSAGGILLKKHGVRHFRKWLQKERLTRNDETSLGGIGVSDDEKVVSPFDDVYNNTKFVNQQVEMLARNFNWTASQKEQYFATILISQ